MAQTAATGVSNAAFLVERYWPGVDEDLLSSALPRLELSARAMTAEGHEVHHVGSFLMPADQVVLSVIRAESEAMVWEVNQRAAMPVDRVARVTSYGFGGNARTPT
jgi:Flp pilus assembly protein CpaB